MTQLKLCKIPSQRSKEPEIPHHVMRAYVQGFQARQQERERRRAEQQAQEGPRPAKRTLFDQEEPMNTAQEFARFALEFTQQAERIKPAAGDPYEQTRKLIQYHLHTAASKAREIAEALAKQEPLSK